MKRALVILCLFACSRAEPEPRPAPSASAAAPLVAATGVRIEAAAEGADATAIVRAVSARERKLGRDVVVYVGAVWCEPCQRFHKAAAAGALDADFPTLTLLEFDLDADRDRLARAGYTSEMIPLFVKPNADGTAGERRLEGSIKGDGAVANITPRLRRLLAE